MGTKRNTWNNIASTAKGTACAPDLLLAEIVQAIQTHRNAQYFRLEALAHEIGQQLRAQSPGCKPRTYMHMAADRILWVLDSMPPLG
jgi:hypothetical protein